MGGTTLMRQYASSPRRLERRETNRDSRRQKQRSQSGWVVVWEKRVSGQRLEHTGPAEKERVVPMPQSEQMASTPEPPFPKEKGTEPSLQIMRRERVKVGQSHTLARERGIRAAAYGGNSEHYSKGEQISRR